MANIAFREYLGDVITLCEECLIPITARVVVEGGCVYYYKQCLQHGGKKTLISTDVKYYRRCTGVATTFTPPLSPRQIYAKGCPFDCGLCDSHEQRCIVGIIEVTDDCNMRCPTCIASSAPGSGNYKSLATIRRMLDLAIEKEGELDVVMISGGEPTIHPDIIAIVEMVEAMRVKHTMLITNGRRLAEDRGFVDALATSKDNFEIYLQFDSLRESALRNIRGEDLREVRRGSLAELERVGIASTLVCVVKKGVNDDEIGTIIRHALGFRYVRGVTFQPVKITGRNETFLPTNYVTLSEIRSGIMSQCDKLDNDGMIPHPCNPERIAIGYLNRDPDGARNVTAEVMRGGGVGGGGGAAGETLFFLPCMDSGNWKWHDLFRVAIVSYMDRFDFCVTAARRSCIHFITERGEIIPSDTYYLMYQKPGQGIISMPIRPAREDDPEQPRHNNEE